MRERRSAPRAVTADADKSSSTDWKFELLRKLSEPGAARVLRYGELFAMGKAIRPTLSPITMRSVLDGFMTAGFVRRIGNGIYINERCFPAATPIEAIGLIRSGAVASLHSVLGERGVINSPSNIPTAVVPIGPHSHPHVGEVVTDAKYVYRFYGLPERFFPHVMGRDVLDPVKPYPSFRPEKALLDWVYLGESRYSKMTPPPVQVDLDMIDLDLARRFADRMAVRERFEGWLEKARAMNYGSDPEDEPMEPLASSTDDTPIVEKRVRSRGP